MKSVKKLFKASLGKAFTFFVVISFIGLSFGCSGIGGNSKSKSDNNKADEEKAYVVSGKILFEGEKTTDRAATTSFAIEDGYEYVLSVCHGVINGEGIISWDQSSGKIVEITEENGVLSYEVKLTENGLWMFNLFAVNEGENITKMLLTKQIEITEDFKPIICDLVIKPSFLDTTKTTPETSSVKLDVYKNLGENPENDVVKVIWTWKEPIVVADANGLPDNVRNLINPWFISQKPVEKVFEDNEEKVTFEFDDVPAWSYNIELTFVTESGEYISIYEIVNVFKNFVTDSWYGQEAHFQCDDNGKYNFVITPDFLSEAGDRIVIYNYSSGTYNYYLKNDFDLLNLNQSETIIQSENGKPLDFCFDSNGNIIFLCQNENAQWYIISDFTHGGQISLPGIRSACIAYDSITNNIYVMDYNYEDSDFKNKIKITNITKMLYENVLDEYEITISSNSDLYNNGTGYEPKDFVVNNGIVYIAFTKLNKTNTELISTWKNDWKVAAVAFDSFTKQTSSSETNNNYTTTNLNVLKTKSFNYVVLLNDMLYQDNKLFLVFNAEALQLNNVSGITYSCGGILCYNVTNNNNVLSLSDETVIGLTEDTILNPDSAEELKGGITYNGEMIYEYNSDLEDYITVNKDFVSFGNFDSLDYTIRAPYNSLQSYFVGPQRFIAIKPKKLVITDTGIAFYTDRYGVLKYKDVSRVVYVDLETLSISDSIDIDMKLCDNWNYPEVKYPGITDSLNFGYYEYYKYNTSSGEFTRVSGSGSDDEIKACFIKDNSN